MAKVSKFLRRTNDASFYQPLAVHIDQRATMHMRRVEISIRTGAQIAVEQGSLFRIEPAAGLDIPRPAAVFMGGNGSILAAPLI